MNKAIEYATKGAIILAAGNALVNSLQRLNSTQEFDWQEFLKALAKGALVGGVAGFIAGAFRDQQKVQIFQRTAGLSGYLQDKLQIYHDDSLEVINKANYLCQLLYDKFEDKLAEYPSINGSALKGTSIEGSDIDIQVVFKRKTDTVKNVYSAVEFFCSQEIDDPFLESIRSQPHSVGLSFNISNKIKKVDIVPLRKLNNKRGDTYLFVRNNTFFGQSSYKKTNIQEQLKTLQFSEKEKKIVKLLKVWKLENGLNIKSIHLEYLTKRAFEKITMPRKVSDCFLEVIKFIGYNIVTLRVIDPGNSNNVISDTLSYKQKVVIENFCFRMLDEIEKSPINAIDFFPLRQSIYNEG